MNINQVMQKFQNSNKFFKLSMKYSKVKELMDYITVIGPADDKKRSYKFPLTASQILSSDISSIIEFVLPQGEIFEQVKTQIQQEVEVEVQSPQIQEKQVNEQKEEKKQTTIIKESLQGLDEQVIQNEKSVEQSPQKSENQNKQITDGQSKETLDNTQKERTKIKIKKIQKVQKIQKIPVQPLINYLFNYFDQQVNYVLTGYVCKTLVSILSKKPNLLLQFLFTQNKIDKIIKHIQSRSVGQFLLKLLTFQSNLFTKQRSQFFTKLLQKLSQNNQIYMLSNFSSFVCQTIEKAASNIKGTNPISQFTNIFFTPQIVAIVIRNVISDYQNVSVYNAPILFTYLTNVPFTLPQDQNIINQFKNLLKMFIQKSLQKTKLGVGRIKIIQILGYILKENLLNSRQIFASQEQGFSILFDLCKKYEMNNVLHNEIVKIISIAFTDQLFLSKALLRNDDLLNFIVNQAQQDVKIRNGNGNKMYRKGYIGHIVQICRLIQEYASKGNNEALAIEQRKQFQDVLQKLVEKQVYEGNKSLGGFNLNKQLKSEVMFQKEDIIAHYYDFLTHSPKPVFESQPEPINIEHPDFLQQMERQIQQNLSLQQVSKGQNTTISPQISDNVSVFSSDHQGHTQPHFFKGHLDYNVDQLMQELF